MSEPLKETWSMVEEALARRLPAKQPGMPEDIAGACSWLFQEDGVIGKAVGSAHDG
jgi:hypothetical protein